MSSCPSIVYNGVGAAQWSCLKTAAAAAAKANGISIPDPIPDSGIANHLGFAGRWDYDSAAQTLTLQCTAFIFETCANINAKIDAAVKGTGCIP